MRQNPVQRQLILQSVVLIIVISIGFNLLLEQIGVPINWLGVALGVAYGEAIARPENWLFALPFTLLQRQHQNRQFPHVTRLPVPYLSAQIANWLRRDWETGLHNINQLLRFTLQFIPVIKAVNRVLEGTPKDQLIYRVAQLSEDPDNWDLVRFASTSLSEVLTLSGLKPLRFC